MSTDEYGEKNGAPAFALTDRAAASQRNTDRFDLHHRRPKKNNSIHSIHSIHSIPVQAPPATAQQTAAVIQKNGAAA